MVGTDDHGGVNEDSGIMKAMAMMRVVGMEKVTGTMSTVEMDEHGGDDKGARDDKCGGDG